MSNMTDSNHHTISHPEPSFLNPAPPPNNSGGRARSGSNRSQRSQQHNFGGQARDFPFVDNGYQPSIRIRRSSLGLPQVNSASAQQVPHQNAAIEGRHLARTPVGRSRSNSAPQPLEAVANPPRIDTSRVTHMPNLAEETISPSGRISGDVSQAGPSSPREGTRLVPLTLERRASWRPLRRARTNIGEENSRERTPDEEEYDSNLVDLLDVVGKYRPTQICDSTLRVFRSGSCNAVNSHQCAKFSVHSESGKTCE